MKRLIKKSKRKIITSRLRKKVFAEWTPVDINSPNLMETITDAMSVGTWIQVEYEGSGWRLIQPYGWNTSQAGNILLMCYKDTGEIRSYRLDRVLQVLVDDELLTNEPVMNSDPTQMFQVREYNDVPEEFEVPPLPNQDEVLEISENEQGQELPFDEGLDYLTEEDNDIEDNNKEDNDIEDNDIEDNNKEDNDIEDNDIEDNNKEDNDIKDNDIEDNDIEDNDKEDYIEIKDDIA
ncbi:MAG: hypothetical protein ACOCP8_02290 [archaeon]